MHSFLPKRLRIDSPDNTTWFVMGNCHIERIVVNLVEYLSESLRDKTELKFGNVGFGGEGKRNASRSKDMQEPTKTKSTQIRRRDWQSNPGRKGKCSQDCSIPLSHTPTLQPTKQQFSHHLNKFSSSILLVFLSFQLLFASAEHFLRRTEF